MVDDVLPEYIGKKKKPVKPKHKEKGSGSSYSGQDVLPEYDHKKQKSRQKSHRQESETNLRTPYVLSYTVTPDPTAVFAHEEQVDETGTRAGNYEVRSEKSNYQVSYVVGSDTGFKAETSYSFWSF